MYMIDYQRERDSGNKEIGLKNTKVYISTPLFLK
jgi:hypothetical protein